MPTLHVQPYADVTQACAEGLGPRLRLFRSAAQNQWPRGSRSRLYHLVWQGAQCLPWEGSPRPRQFIWDRIARADRITRNSRRLV
jgi:hypothetical protein